MIKLSKRGDNEAGGANGGVRAYHAETDLEVGYLSK